jgi:putative addiction module component (TIGR02574 family)
MTTSLEELSQQALGLPAEQRLELARHLLDSVDLEPEPGAEIAWEAEIAHRIERFDAGESKPLPAAEVFDRLRRIAPGR